MPWLGYVAPASEKVFVKYVQQYSDEMHLLLLCAVCLSVSSPCNVDFGARREDTGVCSDGGRRTKYADFAWYVRGRSGLSCSAGEMLLLALLMFKLHNRLNMNMRPF